MSCCTLLKKVKTRLPGGFAMTELLPADDNTFIFARDARRCNWSPQGKICEPSPACCRLPWTLLDRAPKRSALVLVARACSSFVSVCSQICDLVVS